MSFKTALTKRLDEGGYRSPEKIDAGNFKNFHDKATNVAKGMKERFPHLDIKHNHSEDESTVFSDKTGEVFAHWNKKRGHGTITVPSKITWSPKEPK